MKIEDFMNELYRNTHSDPNAYKETCDVLKIGDPSQEIRKIAAAMMGTEEVIQAAAEWGANLLIVHEPLFYDHWDNLTDLENFPEPKRTVIKKKCEFIRQNGLTIYRYHDHPHNCVPDMISAGETQNWGLKGTWKKGPYWAVNEFTLDNSMTVKELASVLEKNLGIQYIRIAGSPDTVCRKMALAFGTPGHVMEALAQYDVVLTGEICEWMDGEFVRDWNSYMGERKAVLVMGHIPSEREGMRLLVSKLQKEYPQYESKYFESSEVYSYTR